MRERGAFEHVLLLCEQHSAAHCAASRQLHTISKMIGHSATKALEHCELEWSMFVWKWGIPPIMAVETGETDDNPLDFGVPWGTLLLDMGPIQCSCLQNSEPKCDHKITPHSTIHAPHISTFYATWQSTQTRQVPFSLHCKLYPTTAYTLNTSHFRLQSRHSTFYTLQSPSSHTHKQRKAARWCKVQKQEAKVKKKSRPRLKKSRPRLKVIQGQKMCKKVIQGYPRSKKRGKVK